MRRLRWSLVPALLALGCKSENASGVVLVLDTDMTVPDSIDEVGLYLDHEQDGRHSVVLAQRAKPIYDPETGTYSVRFAATLGISSGESKSADRLRSRFVAFAADGAVVAMREARTTLPSTGVKQLRLPLLFVNAGRVQDTQAGLVAPAGSNVDFLEIGTDPRANPFTRFRHPECADEQTLNDLGVCEGIDVAVESLPDYAEPEEGLPIACLSPVACFGETRGVRSVPLSATCTASVPEAAANQVAVAVRTRRGYAIGGAQSVFVQPVDRTLYQYAAGTLTLEPALCAQVQREGLNEVLVSVKCAPKEPGTPICGAWRAGEAAPLAPTTEGFVDDGPAPHSDAGDGSDGDGPLPDVDAPDSAPSYRAIEAFDVALERVNEESYDALVTFAATHEGADRAPSVWAVVGGTQGGEPASHIRYAAPQAGVRTITGAESSMPMLPSDARLELGQGSHVYVLAPSNSDEYPQRYVLAPGSNELTPLQYIDETGAPQYDEIRSELAVGVLAQQTLAVHKSNRVGQPLFVARRPTTAVGDVLDYAAPLLDANVGEERPLTSFGRGSLFGSGFFIPPPGFGGSLLRVMSAPEALTVVPFTLPASAMLETYTARSFVSVDPQHAVAVSVGNFDGGTALHHVVQDDGGLPVVTGNALLENGLRITDEAYGGHGVFCARANDSQGVFAQIFCSRLGAAGFESFTLTGDNEPNLHVFGDADYIYVAKLCLQYEPVSAAHLRVLAAPWVEWTEQTAQAKILELLQQCTVQPIPG